MLIGILNTFIGLSVIFAAKGILRLDDFVSNLLGYSFGLLISYFFNRKWTFHHNGHISRSALRFGIAFLLSYIANLIAFYGLRDGVGLNSYLAQTLSIVPYTLIFYFTCSYYVFIEKHSTKLSQH